MNTKYNLDFENHKNAIIFLKGVIVEYAVECGMKHSSTKINTEYYEIGRSLVKDNYLWADRITSVHILYNRLRHERPHKGSFSLDQQHLKTNPCTKVIASLKEILGDDSVQKLMEGF